jgi:hypothetical protein
VPDWRPRASSPRLTIEARGFPHLSFIDTLCRQAFACLSAGPGNVAGWWPRVSLFRAEDRGSGSFPSTLNSLWLSCVRLLAGRVFSLALPGWRPRVSRLLLREAWGPSSGLPHFTYNATPSACLAFVYLPARLAKARRKVRPATPESLLSRRHEGSGTSFVYRPGTASPPTQAGDPESRPPAPRSRKRLGVSHLSVIPMSGG